jgi:hypothetical protein
MGQRFSQRRSILAVQSEAANAQVGAGLLQQMMFGQSANKRFDKHRAEPAGRTGHQNEIGLEVHWMESGFRQKAQRVASRQRHDGALWIHARRRAEQARIVDEKVFETVDATERVSRAFTLVFAHRTRGEKVDRHQARQSVGQDLWKFFETAVATQRTARRLG